MDKTIFLAWERAFPQKKLFEAWECQIAEVAGLGTAPMRSQPL